MMKRVLSFTVVALLMACGVAWAQDGSLLNLSGGKLGYVLSVIGGAIVPFVAAWINRHNFSKNKKGFIALALSIVFAAIAKGVAGELTLDLSSSDAVLNALLATLLTSQGIHRLFGDYFNKLERATDPDAPAVSVPIAPSDIIAAAENSARNAAKSEVEELKAKVENKLGNTVGGVLGELLDGNSLAAGVPIAPEVDLDGIDETGVSFDAETAPEPLLGTIDWSAARPMQAGA